MNKPLFNKICIVGVGLMGGSIGLATKKRKLTKMVVGHFRSHRSAKEAMRQQAVDVAVFDLKEAVRGADLVILASPVSVIIEQLKKIQPFVKPGAIVIDVGSSKEQINQTAKKYFKSNQFVGCHPMAGSEKQGVQFANPDLFRESIAFVTAENKKIFLFWKALGAQPTYISAKEHDSWVARVSHLPHILSFALFHNFKKDSQKSYELNPSLQDFARLSKSDPKLWTDIFLSNPKEILNAIGAFKTQLGDLEKMIKRRSSQDIHHFILSANRHAATFT